MGIKQQENVKESHEEKQLVEQSLRQEVTDE